MKKINFRWFVAPLLAVGFCSGLFAQIQYVNALLDSSLPDIEVHDDSYITDGCVEDNYILLTEIAGEADGYIEFAFSNLKGTDDIVVSLENAQNANEFYCFEFKNGSIFILDHTGNNYEPPSLAQNNSSFKIQKCSNVIVFYTANNVVLFTKVIEADIPMIARVQAQAAETVSLNATFNSDYTNCPQCATSMGTTLMPTQLQFMGLTMESDHDRFSLHSDIPLLPGTSFLITDAIYEADAPPSQRTNIWTSSSSSDLSSIVIQKITYTGTSSIPANATLCFSLPEMGSSDALLATDFSINDVFSSDFCVSNIGNTMNPLFELNNSIPNALFLMQGHWNFSDNRGIFSGRVLDGYQHNSTWVDFSETATAESGRSRLPEEIGCLPPGSLGDADCSVIGNLVMDDRQAMELDDLIDKAKVTAFPNPFTQNIEVKLSLPQNNRVQIVLLDATGQQISNIPTHLLEKGTHDILLTTPKDLSAGIYRIQVILREEVLSVSVAKVALDNFDNE